MEITSEILKELRNKTGVSVMQCKKALEEAGGDVDKALIILQKKGGEAAAKKSDRQLGAGTVGSYLHSTGEVAALVHLACETDFVAKNEGFVALARDIAMHVAAQNPKYVRREDVPEEELANVRDVFGKEIGDKPADIREKILAGKMDAYFADRVLLEQAFIKDPEKTIGDLVSGAVQKFGENTSVVRIARISVKEG